MKREKSCGAIAFTWVNGRIRYLLIRNCKGVYGFPKGHVEPCETETETALREVREETGLAVTLRDDFRETEAYPATKKPDVIKDVVYFIGGYADQTPVPQQSEFMDVGLYSFDEAMERLTFASRRTMLEKADALLNTVTE